MNPGSKKADCRCAIMQPTFLPWLGYFDLMDQVDHFVFYDDVQLEKRSWQIRNRIKNAQGEHYLSVQCKKNKEGAQEIAKTTLSDERPWREKHFNTIHHAYRKSTHYEEVANFLKPLLVNNITTLATYNVALIAAIAERMGVNAKLYRASETFADTSGDRVGRLAAICDCLNCNIYLSPQGSAPYLLAEKGAARFAAQGIRLCYHQWRHPSYPQPYGEFIPNMSIVDLLFNAGFEGGLAIIRSGRMPEINSESFRANLDGNGRVGAV